MPCHAHPATERTWVGCTSDGWEINWGCLVSPGRVDNCASLRGGASEWVVSELAANLVLVEVGRLGSAMHGKTGMQEGCSAMRGVVAAGEDGSRVKRGSRGRSGSGQATPGHLPSAMTTSSIIAKSRRCLSITSAIRSKFKARNAR